MSFTMAPVILLVVALLMLLAGAWVLFQQQWLLQWLKGTGGLLLIVLAVYSSLFAVSVYSFSELDPDRSVATISFRETGPQRYIATVSPREGSRFEVTINGDLWQASVRTAVWRGVFGFLNVAPGYQMHSISGRYLALEDERTNERSHHVLATESMGYKLWERGRHGRSLMFDGSVLRLPFTPVEDGAIFEINYTRDHHLSVTAMNGSAQAAIGRWE